MIIRRLKINDVIVINDKTKIRLVDIGKHHVKIAIDTPHTIKLTFTKSLKPQQQ